MKLEDLKRIRPVTKLRPICEEAGVNFHKLRSAIERESPELSPKDEKALLAVLKKHYDWIARET